jgi:hypothetical protein
VDSMRMVVRVPAWVMNIDLTTLTSMTCAGVMAKADNAQVLALTK